MRTKRITVFFVIICFFSVYALKLAASPQTNLSNRILVVNAYNEFYPWSNIFIKSMVKTVSHEAKADIHIVHMNLLLDNDEMLDEQWNKMMESYTLERPRMVVFLGTPSFALCDNVNQKWPNIPMVLCGEQNNTGTSEHIQNAENSRIPLEQLRLMYNLTFLSLPTFLEENICLMKQIIPNMDTLMYVGDETYISQQNNCNIENIVRYKFKNLTYRFLSTKALTTDSLFSILCNIDSNTTGVLFGTWMHRRSFKDNSVMMANSHRIFSTVSVPLFSYRFTGIKNEDGIIGGYVYQEDELLQHLDQVITEILSGKRACDIAPFYLDTGTPAFNYHSLKQHGISLSKCPENSIFYNMPPTFWDEYKYYMIGAVIILIFLFILAYMNRLRTKTMLLETQKRNQENMKKNHNIINNMPILYMLEEIIWDEEGHIKDTIFIEVNKLFNDTFLLNEKCIGKLVSELFPESMETFFPNMEIAIKEKKAVSFSYYFETINTYYDVLINPSSDGKYIHTYCIDNTSLHRTQEELRTAHNKLMTVLEVADITPWRWDLQTNIISYTINENVNTDFLGETFDGIFTISQEQRFSMIHKDDYPRVMSEYKELIEGKVEKVRSIYRTIAIINGEEHTNWIEVQGGVDTYDHSGRPLALIGSTHNITKNKEMELELIQAKEKAEISNHLKSKFLANMSHEIRTPLNAIVGFSQILATAETQEEKQEYIRIILNNNNLLLQLIGDILDLSKIEAGTMEYVYSDFDLNQLLVDLHNSFLLKLQPAKQVSLSYETGMDECYIHFEKNRLSQIFINLITNAIKFTDEGSIRYGYKVPDGEELYLYVTDTGRGIPADKLEETFKRFVKLNNFVQGTGLGLSICKMLLEQLGGSIGVESEEGKGTTFWFKIPYKPTVRVSVKKTDAEITLIKEQKIDVLVAEDHESNYRLIEAILRKEYNLIHAWNGKEAVELFEKHSPQLVLLDISMPVMDGYETITELKKRSTKVPIIAVTAFAYASDEQKVQKYGFDAYVSKPINANLLKGKMKEVLKQYFSFD